MLPNKSPHHENRKDTVVRKLSRFGNRRGRRVGTAATEFAIVFPLMLVVTIGCIDLGRVAHSSMALINGVSSAGEFAATYSFTDYTYDAGIATIEERITEELQTLSDFDPSKLTTVASFDDQGSDQPTITIDATYPFELVTSLPGLPGEIVLNHRIQVVRYR